VTLREKISVARARLVAAGIDKGEAGRDASLLARHLLGWNSASLLTNDDQPATPEFIQQFEALIERRARREPVAYIRGTQEFWNREFIVTPAVLIPRPETELIIEELLMRLPSNFPARPQRIADIGTGSGCLAVSLAHEIAGAHITATEVSRTALTVARDNARRLGVSSRVTFVETSFLDGIDGPFDLIAANPPYVKDGDKPALSHDVRHEPDVALFGGETGLQGVEAVLEAAVRTLVSGGWLVMEFGFGQEDDVRHLVAARPALRMDRVRADLQGIPRTAVIQRS